MAKKKKKKKEKYDWEAIWSDYRAGVLSITEVSKRHKIDRSYMSRKAKALGITRDLSKRVKQAVETKLVSGLVPTSGATDEEIVDQTSSEVVQVVRLHRKTIKKGRDVVHVLLEQLVDSATNRDELEEAIEEETKEESSAHRRNQMLKAVSLQTHSSIAANLANSMRSFVNMERQAYNLNDSGDDSKTFSAEEVINKRHEELKP